MTVHAERLPRPAIWAGMAGTALIHGAAVLVILLGLARTPRVLPPTFAVELIAAPQAASGSALGRTVTEPPPPPAPTPAPVRAKPVPRIQRAPTRARTPSQVTPLPRETPGTGSDIANVKLPGKAFPFPEYLRNLVAQIYRRWNRPADNSPLTAEVGFVILRDGSVRDIRMVAGSRSYSFDQEALGAVEAAAQVKAFGPLPAGYGADYLQVSFLFQPRP